MSEFEPVSHRFDVNSMLHPVAAKGKMQMHYRRYVGRECPRQYAPRAASSLAAVLARMNRSEASVQFSM
jgi:hypothetical protein